MPRPLTEARRQQNRLNQRAYRLKQRAQRLQDSQNRSQSSSAQNVELRPRTANQERGGTSVTREPRAALETSLPELIGGQMATVPPREDLTVLQLESPLSSLDCGSATQAVLNSIFDLENTSRIHSDPPPTTNPSVLSTGSSSTCIPSDLDFSCPSSALFQTNDLPDKNGICPSALEFLEQPNSVDQDWYPTQDTSSWLLSPPSDLPAEHRSNHRRHHRNILEEAASNGNLDTNTFNATEPEALLQGHQPAATTSQITPSPPPLPNPWRNSIQFSQTKIFTACIQNAQSMGFLVQNVATTPACMASSPFHQPVTPNADPKTLLAGLTQPSTPAHLAPTLPQVLYPHPAFMDFIPLPAFRARAITLAATRPQSFDIWDLKKDMFVEDGLVLWGSGGGGGGAGACGQPWDMRSWEAAPWFLRKWRVLVGSEEGEVWKQSLWWPGARGVA